MGEKANADIYDLIRNKGLRIWWVAYKIGMQDSNFSRLLRKPLPEDKRKLILHAIERLEADGGLM